MIALAPAARRIPGTQSISRKLCPPEGVYRPTLIWGASIKPYSITS